MKTCVKEGAIAETFVSVTLDDFHEVNFCANDFRVVILVSEFTVFRAFGFRRVTAELAHTAAMDRSGKAIT